MSSSSDSTPLLPTSLEMELLLCCARARLSADQETQIRSLLKTEIDWDRLTETARRHGLFPLLYWHLNAVSAGGDSVPALGGLRGRFADHARQALQLTHELLKVLQLFGENKIPAVPYKGPVMAACLYGSLALRQVGDLDILIRKGDVLEARALLLSRGYVPIHPLGDATRKFKLAHGYCEEFRSPNGEILELHWGFTNGDVRFPVVLEDLLPRLRRIAVGGVPVLSFAPEDLLLILCVHGAKHRWDRLEWVCGVAELLRSSEALDWVQVQDRAKKLGSWRTLMFGSLLAHDLLGAPLPPTVLDGLHREKQVLVLTAEVLERLLAEQRKDGEGMGGPFSRDFYMLRLRDNVADRLRYLWHRGARRVARATPRGPRPIPQVRIQNSPAS